MRKTALVLGMIGASVYAAQLIGSVVMLARGVVLSILAMVEAGEDYSANMIPSTRYLFNSVLVNFLPIALSAVFLVLFLRALLRFRKAKPVHPAMLIVLLVFSGLSLLTMISAIPKYIVLSKLGLLNTIWTVYVPAASTFLAAALVLMMVLNKRQYS